MNADKGKGKEGKENIKEFINDCKEFGEIVDISCGAHYTLMVKSNGKVYGWGKN